MICERSRWYPAASLGKVSPWVVGVLALGNRALLPHHTVANSLYGATPAGTFEDGANRQYYIT